MLITGTYFALLLEQCSSPILCPITEATMRISSSPFGCKNSDTYVLPLFRR